jgi:hypothetical protein
MRDEDVDVGGCEKFGIDEVGPDLLVAGDKMEWGQWKVEL